ncbi:MAG: RNA-binding protein [Oligoflexia bacterium]|nr:RNA-binding protein [Oligoflexia bacterium]
MKKLFIGKLAFATTETSLRAFFAEYEPLLSVKIINDAYTGRSRGFGFIEVEDSAKADAAIQALNGAELDGATLVVNEANPDNAGKSRRPSTFRGGFGDDRRSRPKGNGGSRPNRY